MSKSNKIQQNIQGTQGGASRAQSGQREGQIGNKQNMPKGHDQSEKREWRSGPHEDSSRNEQKRPLNGGKAGEISHGKAGWPQSHNMSQSGGARERENMNNWSKGGSEAGRWSQNDQKEGIGGSAQGMKGAGSQSDQKIWLKMGSRGEEVSRMQSSLCKAGWSIAKDGIFGSATEKAVKEFQTKNHLKIDGIVGPQTWQKICDMSKGARH